MATAAVQHNRTAQIPLSFRYFFLRDDCCYYHHYYFFFHYWLGVFEFVRFFSCLSLDIFTNCCHPLNIPPHTRTYTKALTFTYSFTRRHVHTQTHIAHWGALCECVFLWISSPLVINIYILTCNCDQVLVCMLIQYIFGSIAYNFIFVSFFFEFLAIFF